MTPEDLARIQREEVKEKFKRLIRRISAPVAVFIDDLDRCKAEYVVEILEGIQTLLKEVPVVVVVAADRRWLHESYREMYLGYSNAVKEPGRPMEYLFLEKAFQMSVPIPELTADLQVKYLKYLLMSTDNYKERNELDKGRQTAKDLFKGVNSEKEIYGVIDNRQNLPDPTKRAIILEAMVQFADKVTLKNLEMEHRLQKFAPLLEPNPRAMKRFVNDWDINRTIALWAEMDIDKDQLALWTILMRRWPLLAYYLHDHPKKIIMFSETSEVELNEIQRQDSEFEPIFLELINNDEVRRVVTGQIGNIKLPVQLDEDLIKKCRCLCAR